ncbi:MAG: GH92 family glycosyl hydrolase [Bacteroidales bacterium]|nr:GH92 family glycosyl hydrolase [Bacteroidales bacterium]
MKYLKLSLKYLGIILSSLLLIISAFISVKAMQYRKTVKAIPGKIDTPAKPGSMGSWVDPFIGTGGFPPYTSGDDIPGVTMPFGMVRLSPDTKFFLGSYFGDGNTVSTAGYYYGDNRLMGFSHTRLIGTGASDGGHFRVIPSTGDDGFKNYMAGRFIRFSHKDERAFPGYYAINLPRPGIFVELTAGEHTGIHRYTFSKKETPHILIDVSSTLGRGRAGEGEVNIYPESREITGTIKSFGSFSGRYGGIRVYFAAIFSEPFISSDVWSGKNLMKNKLSVRGDQIGVDISFANQDERKKIVLKMGISYVSIENARENREAETGSACFDDLLSDAQRKWEDKLSLIRLEGGNDDQRRIFYTALYHSLQMPTLFNDVNGEYTGFDKKVHKAENFRYFTDMSLWDTFRTTHPLFTLIVPKDQRDMIVSLTRMCEQGGVLPRWPSGCGYTGSMLGASADIVIAESYLKGITDFDAEAAYQAMRKAALAIDIPKEDFKPRENMTECLKYSYCPADLMDEAVSKTLEYAYADDAVSKLAMALGHKEDAMLFSRHSGFYKNIWNPETQYFQPRNSTGEFVEKFKPLMLVYLDPDNEYTDDYVEGSALQWRWALFFDGNGLVSLFRDKEYFVNELNDFFAKSDSAVGSWYPGPYYWHGNEPDIHAAWLFNYAGRPDLTQKWVRWILDNKYNTKYDGIDGDDDAGTLSAWYIFSALGFYPVAGSDIYQIGAPLFRKAEVKTGNNLLTIVAENWSSQNKYVSRVWLNDKQLDRLWLKHSELINGGILKFEMSEKPVDSRMK